MSTAAIAAIEYAANPLTDEGIEFLRAWIEGNFEEIKGGWPDAPMTVFPDVPLHHLKPELESHVATRVSESLFIRQRPAIFLLVEIADLKALAGLICDRDNRDQPPTLENINACHDLIIKMLGEHASIVYAAEAEGVEISHPEQASEADHA